MKCGNILPDDTDVKNNLMVRKTSLKNMTNVKYTNIESDENHQVREIVAV